MNASGKFLFMAGMCLTAIGGVSQVCLSATDRSDLDKLAVLYCSSIPFALTTTASEHCASEIPSPDLIPDSISTRD